MYVVSMRHLLVLIYIAHVRNVFSSVVYIAVFSTLMSLKH